MSETATDVAPTPDCEPHTPMPSGYVARAEWFEKMARTHEPRQCGGCGLWAIWERKPGGSRP